MSHNTGVYPQSKTYDPEIMRSDFHHRWNLSNLTRATDEQVADYVTQYIANLEREGYTEVPPQRRFKTLPDTGEGTPPDDDTALSCAYCQGCGAFSGDIRQSHCRPACTVQLYPQKAGEGIKEQWTIRPSGGSLAILYTQSQLDAAVQAAVEKAARLADARVVDYADGEADSASHCYTNGVVRLVAENIAKSIRAHAASELPQEKP